MIVSEDQIHAINLAGRRGFVVSQVHPAESNDYVVAITFTDVESADRHKVDIDRNGSMYPVRA